MTVEKLQAANDLLARINKNKQVKAILELEDISIVSAEGTQVSLSGDEDLRKRIIDAVDAMIESLEYDFKWFDVNYND